MTELKLQLEFILQRLYESELGFYPDQFKDKNLYDLAFKSDAIRSNFKGDRIKMFKPKIGQDGFADFQYTPIVFFISLEKAFDIEIKDEEAEKVFTITDLADLILKKRKEKILIHSDYYDSLIKSPKLNLLIVGKDPFPNGAMGIPFCKRTIKEQTNKSGSGYYILKGLGVKIDDKFDNPEHIFFELLENEGIGFINASYFSLNDKAPKDYQLNISNYLNYPIFKKSKKIVVTNSGLKILKRRTKYHSEFIDKLDNQKILPPTIDNRFIKVIHPAGNNIWRNEHKLVWQQHGGLLKILKDKDWVNDHKLDSKRQIKVS